MPAAPDRPRSLTAGLLLGVGFAGFVDEVVFHQLLHWHHLYDRSTASAALVSDGLLHVGSWVATVVGLVLLVVVQRRAAIVGRRVAAGALVGAGAFQVYDGLVQHKVLRLHQVRYGVDPLPYDLAWNLVGLALLAGGLVLLRRTPVARSRG